MFAYIGRVSLIGIFEIDDIFSSLAKKTSNVAFISGSSKQGKARRASVAWNWVTANILSKLISEKTEECVS